MLPIVWRILSVYGWTVSFGSPAVIGVTSVLNGMDCSGSSIVIGVASVLNGMSCIGSPTVIGVASVLNGMGCVGSLTVIEVGSVLNGMGCVGSLTDIGFTFSFVMISELTETLVSLYPPSGPLIQIGSTTVWSISCAPYKRTSKCKKPSLSHRVIRQQPVSSYDKSREAMHLS
jgi:hypothetical protein